MSDRRVVGLAVFLVPIFLGLLFAPGGLAGTSPAKQAGPASQGAFTGSQSCRECHEKFYRLWAPSHHGKAMQDYGDALAAGLAPQAEPLTIRGKSYLARTGPGQGWVQETDGGKETRLPIKYVLGGKNIYYFLTPMERGRLQTLPLAYDIKKKAWFDTAQSGIRHAGDQPVDWRDASYTFNTSCHGCHVSQYSQNYDLATDTYKTTWREPGINCETCHGPGEAHNRVCREAPKGVIPKDLKITRGGRSFSHAQNNATCSSCHAKGVKLTRSFQPGDMFWDHFDLATLEHRDYYPDGRDLGENYTYTSWLMSPCVKAGGLDCLHCHTSSGRFRQKKEPNAACLPCHEERVKNSPAHSRHHAGTEGDRCISCHMPTTSFARMRRSDHSMLPPMPAATLRFGSPNACNGCHRGHKADWADKLVRQWRQRDYQAGYLQRAELIRAARQRDWSRLPDMLAYLGQKDRDEVFAASLIRLLRACPDEAKWPVLLRAAADASPLVRSAALDQLADAGGGQAQKTLLAALDDPVRLVRVRAARALAAYPSGGLDEQERARLEIVTKEMLRSLLAQPDSWQAHYNLGNFYQGRGRLEAAAQAYRFALRLEPRAVPTMVNLAMVHAQANDLAGAEELLGRALRLQPDNAAALFNLGLLRAEQGQTEQAEKRLRAALKADPQMAPAAYNLGLLIAARQPAEAVRLMRTAYDLQPSPKHALGLSSLLSRAGDWPGAEKVLRSACGRWPASGELALHLSGLYLQQGRRDAATAVLEKALARPALSGRQRELLQAALAGLRQP